LYTLPMSHYCEAARWCLESAGVEFDEKAYLPGIHMMLSPIPSLRKKGTPPEDFSGSDSSTPLWVGPDGSILAFDSWQCMVKFGPPPAPREKELIDTVIGPTTRTIFYIHSLPATGEQLFARVWSSTAVPLWQRALYWTPMRGQVKSRMFGMMVKSEEFVEESREKLRSAIAHFEPLLTQAPYASGELTAAGIALASMMAPVVVPPEYAISFYGEPLFRPEDMTPACREEIETWRKTPLGAWTLEYFRLHRRPGGAKA